jgi:hypothetical protein
MGPIKRIKNRIWPPRPAAVIACVALGIALGGTATALPGTRTVQDNDLKTNSVTARAIRADAVRESEIQAGAVQDTELGTIVSRKDTTSLADGFSGRADVQCDPGEVMIGGGGNVQQSAPDAIFHGSNPTNPVNGTTFNTWEAHATNEAGNLANVDVNVWAICLQ